MLITTCGNTIEDCLMLTLEETANPLISIKTVGYQ